jgi:hypothetical protein
MKPLPPRSVRACFALGFASLLGCASSPPVGSEATVGVWKVLTPADAAALKPRERGLRTNFERIPLAPEVRDRYLVVQGSYLVKCRR